MAIARALQSPSICDTVLQYLLFAPNPSSVAINHLSIGDHCTVCNGSDSCAFDEELSRTLRRDLFAVASSASLAPDVLSICFMLAVGGPLGAAVALNVTSVLVPAILASDHALTAVVIGILYQICPSISVVYFDLRPPCDSAAAASAAAASGAVFAHIPSTLAPPDTSCIKSPTRSPPYRLLMHKYLAAIRSARVRPHPRPVCFPVAPSRGCSGPLILVPVGATALYADADTFASYVRFATALRALIDPTVMRPGRPLAVRTVAAAPHTVPMACHTPTRIAAAVRTADDPASPPPLRLPVTPRHAAPPCPRPPLAAIASPPIADVHPSSARCARALATVPPSFAVFAVAAVARGSPSDVAAYRDAVAVAAAAAVPPPAPVIACVCEQVTCTGTVGGSEGLALAAIRCSGCPAWLRTKDARPVCRLAAAALLLQAPILRHRAASCALRRTALIHTDPSAVPVPSPPSESDSDDHAGSAHAVLAAPPVRAWRLCRATRALSGVRCGALCTLLAPTRPMPSPYAETVATWSRALLAQASVPSVFVYCDVHLSPPFAWVEDAWPPPGLALSPLGYLFDPVGPPSAPNAIRGVACATFVGCYARRGLVGSYDTDYVADTNLAIADGRRPPRDNALLDTGDEIVAPGDDVSSDASSSSGLARPAPSWCEWLGSRGVRDNVVALRSIVPCAPRMAAAAVGIVIL